MVKRWRQLAVWLHVLTSVGWMAQAMALCVLLATGLAAGPGTEQDAATSMALVLDGRLLAPMADASAFTGIMLAAATPWGFFRHWWVLIKFVITMVQLNVGIFLLSPALNHAAAAGPTPWQVAGGALMASAIAFQGWLSIAKPFGRVRPQQRTAPAVGPRWIFVATVLGGLADLVLAFVIGHPLPLLSLALIGAGLSRRRTRASLRPTAATPG
ncbi:hypothetical protein [Actinoplanes couchii]|uniref:Integral membrane protein n=1 Tax=Actinoplanes couchii TaxID=403638 RepID=A0ABQ3XLP7_9ACTN|nr:hypothetical protein [Actinoplanes couchii]MDR6318239.1 hypothetical protein [Actinoplanes couchii]GID59390.1 hypothetical protein Aco03nite_077940 [Actinoplanes couchii]